MEIRTGEWQGGRRALLACKLKCCHLNANKTPSRARVGERGGEGEKRWSEKDGCAYGGKKKGEGEREKGRGRGWQIARQRCLRGREEISKRILLPPSLQLRPFGNMAPSRSLSIPFHALFQPTFPFKLLSNVRVQRVAILRTRHYELWNVADVSNAIFSSFGGNIVSAACCVAATTFALGRFQVTGSGAVPRSLRRRKLRWKCILLLF